MGGSTMKALDPMGSKLREDNPNPLGKAGTPDAPDYMGAAQATADANRDINTQQTYANRPTTSTPWGTQSWETGETIDPATGKKVTTWNQNIKLNPEQQAALDSQNKVQLGRSQMGEQLVGQATDAFSTPFDWDSAPEGGSRVDAQGTQRMQGDSSQWRQRGQDAISELNAPQLKEARTQMEARLANQGITAGSEAYNTEMRNLSDNEQRANLMAISAGRDEAGQMFNQDAMGTQINNAGIAADNASSIQAGDYNSRLRQQKIAELAQKRGMPLNELNALLSGQQVTMPGQPTSSQAGKYQGADITGAMGQTYGAQMDAANAQNAQAGQTAGAMGSAAMAAMMFY